MVRAVDADAGAVVDDGGHRIEVALGQTGQLETVAPPVEFVRAGDLHVQVTAHAPARIGVLFFQKLKQKCFLHSIIGFLSASGTFSSRTLVSQTRLSVRQKRMKKKLSKEILLSFGSLNGCCLC